MNETILIYVPQVTARLTYVFDIIWADILGANYKLTTNIDEFSAYEGPRFSYANEPIADEVFQQIGSDILFETGLKPQPINIYQQGELYGLYPVNNTVSLVSFDFLATAFMLVTRYEEYLAHRTDKHGRFRASASTQAKGDFLSKPMVNYYARWIQDEMVKKYPGLSFRPLPFQFINTFDIDIAYAYKYKTTFRNVGGLIRSALLSNFEDVRNRILTTMRGRKDPYDTYDYIHKVCSKYNAPMRFFFLLGDESEFDKNLSHKLPPIKALVKKLHQWGPVGIHLSYESHKQPSTAATEVDRLRDILGVRITSNRFHYLKMHYPSSYQKLVKLGITEDYTMGYASRVGFRMSTTVPVYFFDVKENRKTNLKLFPITYMDATLNHYYKLKPRQAEQRIMSLLAEVKSTGGVFMALWHNSSLSEVRPWYGWRKVFENVTEAAAK